MRKCSFSRCLASLGLVCALAAPAGAASVDEVAAASFDAVILRPLNVGAFALGCAFFAIASPMVAVNGLTHPELSFTEAYEDPWDAFVYGPADNAFLRPLGDL